MFYHKTRSKQPVNMQFTYNDVIIDIVYITSHLVSGNSTSGLFSCCHVDINKPEISYKILFC